MGWNYSRGQQLPISSAAASAGLGLEILKRHSVSIMLLSSRITLCGPSPQPTGNDLKGGLDLLSPCSSLQVAGHSHSKAASSGF